MNNPSSQTELDYLISNLIAKDALLSHLVTESFNLFFAEKEHFQQSLNNGKLLFKQTAYDGDISIYILFVKHKNTISVMQKIYHHQLEDSAHLCKVLQEYLGLF